MGGLKGEFVSALRRDGFRKPWRLGFIPANAIELQWASVGNDLPLRIAQYQIMVHRVSIEGTKGQAQQLTDIVVSVNFSDYSGSLSWSFYCDYLPLPTC
jgi:hypothetical protein